MDIYAKWEIGYFSDGFDGWYTTADGDELYQWTNQITADTVIYAHWTRQLLGYTVKYVDENGNDIIVPGNVMPMQLVFDHRALDFGKLIPFIKRLEEIFDRPEEIFEW